jgi:coproporphyrinogen III oxidase
MEQNKATVEVSHVMVRQLHAAIERVRTDVEQVEFWADAMSAFLAPVPDYAPSDATVWLPAEQARLIGSETSRGG